MPVEKQRAPSLPPPVPEGEQRFPAAKDIHSGTGRVKVWDTEADPPVRVEVWAADAREMIAAGHGSMDKPEAGAAAPAKAPEPKAEDEAKPAPKRRGRPPKARAE